MDFQAQLQQEMQAMQSNSNQEKVEYPNSKLAHKELYFDKNTKSHTVRILPPVDTDKFFAVPTKEIYLTTRNKNGKDLKLQAVLPHRMDPATSNLARNLNVWQQQERVPNAYNRKAYPSQKFYVNVIQISADTQGNFIHETDAQGNPVIRLMKLPQSAYSALLAKISDPMYKPQGSDEYGILSAENAFPVRITKPEKNASNKAYTVDVYQRDLGALPPTWKDLVEDLEYQATPSEDYNGNFVDYFIDVVNGVEGQGNDSQDVGQQAPVVPQQGFQQAPQQGFQQPQAQQGFNQQAPQQGQGQFGGQQQPQGGFNQQAPQQTPPPQQGFQQAPQQGFNQAPQQGFQQAPQQGFNQGFNQSTPVDMGEPDPFNKTGVVADSELPGALGGNTTPSQQQQAPQASQGGFKDVNDILASMKQNLEQ